MTDRECLLSEVKEAYVGVHPEYWLRLSARYLESLIGLIPEQHLSDAMERLEYHYKQVLSMQSEVNV